MDDDLRQTSIGDFSRDLEQDVIAYVSLGCSHCEIVYGGSVQEKTDGEREERREVGSSSTDKQVNGEKASV